MAGNAALATSIKSAYDQVGGYKVVANDGTVHDNVFDLILEPSMLQKVRQSDNFANLQQDQNPVYDYCGNVIGFTSVTTGGSPERSQGQAPITSNLAGNLSAGDRATPQANIVQSQKSPGVQASNLTSSDVSEETQAPPRLPSYTTVEREKLNPINGDIIFNETDKKIEAYVTNQWIDLATGGGSGGGGREGSIFFNSAFSAKANSLEVATRKASSAVWARQWRNEAWVAVPSDLLIESWQI